MTIGICQKCLLQLVGVLVGDLYRPQDVAVVKDAAEAAEAAAIPVGGLLMQQMLVALEDVVAVLVVAVLVVAVLVVVAVWLLVTGVPQS
jgi:hypothetical protein